MDDETEITDLLKVRADTDFAANSNEVDCESTSSSTFTDEESIAEELEEQPSALSTESEKSLLDLTKSSKSCDSAQTNSLASVSGNDSTSPKSSMAEKSPSISSGSSESVASTSIASAKIDEDLHPSNDDGDSTATHSHSGKEDDELEAVTSETEENRNNRVANKSESELKNCVEKIHASASINKTILSDKIPVNRRKVSTYSTSSNEEYIHDPTMPDIEAFHCPKNIMKDLAEPDFDIWRLDRDSMVDHIEYMYHDLGIVRAWKIPRTTLKMFLLGVRERYQDNPYHNFKHCFCVAQMAYSMLCKLHLKGLVTVDHMGALLTAAVCHDVDHPGLNNTYHSHARTPLAILYNYQSILEQHHFAVTCRILSNKERNIFRNVPNRDEVLTNIGDLILATDLAQHKKTTENYTNCISEGFNFKNSEHVMALLKIIIKCADVSNEVRPARVSGPWVERLFAEYYEQSAREKREQLPVTPYMDPDVVNVSESQESFIRGVMLPLYNQLGKLIVDAQLFYINPINETLTRYELQNTRNRKV